MLLESPYQYNAEKMFNSIEKIIKIVNYDPIKSIKNIKIRKFQFIF